jgi:hypothetical protein
MWRAMRRISIPAMVMLLGCGPRERPAAPEVAQAPLAQAPLAPQIAQAAALPAGAHGCQEGSFDHFHPAQRVAPAVELHVIGVYEGQEVQGPHGVEPRGSVAVHVARPGHDVVLALSAYDPVDWKITVEPGTRLQQVILTGYHAQRATAPAGVPLDIYGSEDNRPLIREGGYGYQWPSFQADQVAQAAQGLARVPLTSFRGCYRSSHFVIGDEAPTPEPRLAGGPLAKCASVLREKRRCMALAGLGSTQVVAVGLDSGTACLGPAIHGFSSHGNASLGWIGDRLYVCDRERGVVEIAVADGATRVAPVRCEAVTSLGKSLLLVPQDHSMSSRMDRYASFDDLRNGKVAEQLAASGHASRYAARGKAGYYAWHSTDEIQIVPLVGVNANRSSTSVKLEKYNDWIFGLDALSDGTLVIGSPSRTGRDLRLFDGKTGAQVQSISLGLGRGADISGLKCEGP